MQWRLHITLEFGSRADIEISSIEHHLLDPYVLQYSTTVRKILYLQKIIKGRMYYNQLRNFFIIRLKSTIIFL
jgi:hypothetical protein